MIRERTTPRLVAIAIASVAFCGAASAARAQSTCVDCHSTRSEARLRAPLDAVPGDAHDAAGIGCVDCHGGDPTEPTVRAHSLVLGFVGVPDPLGTTRFCGRCHDGSREGLADVLSEHRAGAHGRAIAMGRSAAATCTSCHGVHGIVAIDDPAARTSHANVVSVCASCHASADHLGGADLALDVVPEYRESVHGRAVLAGNADAPTCVSCHGQHDNAAGHRATQACGECHESVREAFDTGPHAEAYARLGFSDCAECHGRHDIRRADATLLRGIGAACSRCHGPDSETTERVHGIAALARRLDALRAAHPDRDDPARVAAVTALHRLDLDALTAALAGVEELPPGAEAATVATRTVARPWGTFVGIAVALGVATTALVAWVLGRRRRTP